MTLKQQLATWTWIELNQLQSASFEDPGFNEDTQRSYTVQKPGGLVQTVQLEQPPVAVGPFQVPRECDHHDDDDDDDDDDYEDDDDDDDGFAHERSRFSQIFSYFAIILLALPQFYLSQKTLLI